MRWLPRDGLRLRFLESKRVSLTFWSYVDAALGRGEDVFVALVADNTRRSPGTRGAKLCIRANGETFGTIGGGGMELNIIRRAVEVLNAVPGNEGQEGFVPEVQRLFHRQGGQGEKSGLICAGNQTNVYLVLRAQDGETVAEIARRASNDVPGVVRISPAGLQLVDEEITAESLENWAPIRFESDLAEGESRARTWQYDEQIQNWKRVAIFGGGHCGLALSRTMAQLGYVVTVFDTRPDVATFRDNEYATYRVVVDDLADGGAQITQPHLTYVVVMTTNLDGDVRSLLGVLDGPYPYIGLMGAPAKLVRIQHELTEAGFSPQAFERVRAPIGLPMASDTPEEIAISVAAEILQERGRRS